MVDFYYLLSANKRKSRIQLNAYFKCTKNLYKSTYKGNAFIKGKYYLLLRYNEFIWIEDENKQEFNFSDRVTMEELKNPEIRNTTNHYHILDYFEITKK